MDKEIIENKGVSEVYDYLADIGYIKPYLMSNDKTPMWDGSLFVYKSKDTFTNDQFEYRIPVQVKASELKNELFPDSISYSIEISDLISYLHDGGLVFFVVLIKGKNKEIYCYFLTKNAIGEIIGTAKDKKTKTVRIPKAPKDGRFFMDCLKRIYLQREHPLLDLSVLHNKTNYTINLKLDHLSENEDPIEYIATHAVDVLFSYDDIPVEFYPKGGPVRLHMSQTEEKHIIVGNRVFYPSFKRSYLDDGIHISIGRSLDIRIPYKREEHFNINFNIKLNADTLDSLIQELEFIQAIYKERYFIYGASKFCIPGLEDNDIAFKEWEKSLSFWKDVKNVLELLHVIPTFNPELLTNKDIKSLDTLIQAFVYNKPVYSGSSNDMAYMYHIADMIIFVFAKHIKGREFRLMEVYDNLSTAYTDTNNVERVAPILSYILNQDVLPSNLNLKNIVELYKKYHQYNKMISQRAVEDWENMLNHYDIRHDARLLDAALELAKYLMNEKGSVVINKNMLLLNYMQTLLRKKGSLSSYEKKKLYNMKSLDNVENFTRFLLLGDKDRARDYIYGISEDELIILKTQPIYHFMNE